MKTDIHINEAKEIETLKKENYNLSFKNQNLEGQLRTNNIEMRKNI